MKVTINIKGAEEIKRRLNMMPREVSGAYLREVALQGAEVIREEAVKNALKHKRTGTLARDIHSKIGRETIGVRVIVKIGPGKEGWYGRLLEMGHALVRGRRKAEKRVVGHVPPYPWLRPAFDAKKREAQELMLREFKRRLNLR